MRKILLPLATFAFASTVFAQGEAPAPEKPIETPAAVATTPAPAPIAPPAAAVAPVAIPAPTAAAAPAPAPIPVPLEATPDATTPPAAQPRAAATPPPLLEPQPDASERKKYRIGLALYADLGTRMKLYGKETIAGNTFNFNGHDDLDAGYGIALSVQQAIARRWEFGYSFAFEPNRAINSFYLWGDNREVAGQYDPAIQMSAYVLGFSAKFYTNDMFYVTAGGEIGYLATSDSSITLNPAFGIKIGLGVTLAEHIDLEIAYRERIASGKESGVVDGFEYDSSYTYYLGDTMLTARFMF